MNDIKNALIEDDLEIEGYIRADHFRDATKMVNEWTRFDHCNWKTFTYYPFGRPMPFPDWRPLSPLQETEAKK